MKPISNAPAKDTRPVLTYTRGDAALAAKQVVAAMRADGSWYVLERSYPGHRRCLCRLTDRAKLESVSPRVLADWIDAKFHCRPLDGSHHIHVTPHVQLLIELAQDEHGLPVIDYRTAALV